MKSIALTGTIGSGKSACSAYLNQIGYAVFDCDKECHQFLEIDGVLYQKVIDLLGTEIIGHDGQIDRKKVASIIFGNPSLKKEYEQMFHIELKHLLEQQIKENKSLYFAEVPLLYETGFEKLFDEVWLIWCDEETAIERCMKNRGMSEAQVIERIRTQMSTEEKKKRADVLLENNGAVEQLYHQIDLALKELKHHGSLR